MLVISPIGDFHDSVKALPADVVIGAAFHMRPVVTTEQAKLIGSSATVCDIELVPRAVPSVDPFDPNVRHFAVLNRNTHWN
jgi:hypothetical protein